MGLVDLRFGFRVWGLESKIILRSIVDVVHSLVLAVLDLQH